MFFCLNSLYCWFYKKWVYFTQSDGDALRGQFHDLLGSFWRISGGPHPQAQSNQPPWY
jgi:hypothetical protein